MKKIRAIFAPKNYQLLLVRCVRIGTFVLLFMLPMQTRYFVSSRYIQGVFFEYGSYTIYITELIVYTLVAASFYVAWLERKREARTGEHSFLLKKPFAPWGWIFFIYLCATVIFAYNSSQSFIALARIADILLLLWLVEKIVHRFGKGVLIAIIAGITFQAALAIGQFFMQEVPSSTLLGVAEHFPQDLGASVVDAPNARFLRAYGGLPHPNILGGWLYVGMLAVLALFVRVHKKYGLIILSATTVLMSGALIVSFSKSALLAF